MVEAIQSYRERMKLQRAEARAKREAQQAELHRRIVLRVEVQRRAEIAVRQAIRDEGRRKVSQVPRREIKLAAIAYIAAHPELIAQVKPIVEQWRAEGFFGRQAAIRNPHRGAEENSN
jgi:hypothetical protein